MTTYVQAFVDGMNAAMQYERARYQMTLGEMIESLEQMPPDTTITGLGDLDSYRGYYCDLAFSPTDTTETAAELLARCQQAMGQVFIGYKGGEYVMGAKTPLWISHGSEASGVRVMGIEPDGTVITAEDEG